MRKQRNVVPLGEGRARYKVVLLDERECDADSALGQSCQATFLQQFTEAFYDLRYVHLGVPYAEMVMRHDGLRWTITLTAEGPVSET